MTMKVSIANECHLCLVKMKKVKKDQNSLKRIKNILISVSFPSRVYEHRTRCCTIEILSDLFHGDLTFCTL